MTSDWASGVDLLVGLNRTKGLRDGIEHALREAMRDGRLVTGAVLPSSRALASDLGVARGTVSAAYAHLAAEGYLDIRQGAPARVSWLPQRRPPLPSPQRQPVPRWDFRPGLPDSASFPRNAWARAHRQVMARAPMRYSDTATRRKRRAVPGTGRLPGPGTRRRHRPLAPADLQRLHPGADAYLPGAACCGHCHPGG